MTPEHFLELARLLPEPALLVDGQGAILAANPSFARVQGLTVQGLGEKKLFEMVENPPEAVKRYLQACSRTREMVLGALTLRNSRGESHVCRCEGAVLRPWSPQAPALIFLRLKNQESASRRFVLLNQKIEELAKEVRQRQQAEAARAQLLIQEQKARSEAESARAEAEKLSLLKDEFLATVSHELRTPLNAILGWSEILLTSQFNETILRQGLETIERNARSQAQLIDDLLDISRIITGKIRLNVQGIELLPVIESVLNTVRPAAAAKSIGIQSVLDPTAGSVLGDFERLQQVVWNLLNNAIKFTPKQGTVRIALQRVESHVEIVVADTGQGISAEFLPYVFDRFRQEDSSITRSYGGLGLGLAIVDQLVELHGGTVQVASPGEGQGATFTVKLPLLAVGPSVFDPARDPTGTGDSWTGSPRLDGLKLLVVDDEPDIRHLLTYTLEVFGAEVVAVASAEAAIAALASGAFDVLVSDIGMPQEDGYALLRRVRALPPEQGGKIPALALTAYARTQDRTAALLAGFQAHIAKPAQPAELIAAIANLAGRLEGRS